MAKNYARIAIPSKIHLIGLTIKAADIYWIVANGVVALAATLGVDLSVNLVTLLPSCAFITYIS